MIALNIIGVPISSFLAVFSVIGLALSLAVQGVLKNFAGGMIILASKPFSLGDYIEAETVAGTVEEISLLYTRLTTPDGRTIYVPNDVLYSSQMINYTYSGTRRIEVPIGVSYDNTPEQVRAAALDAISTLEGTLADPAPRVTWTATGIPPSITWCRYGFPPPITFSMRYALNERFTTPSARARGGDHLSAPECAQHSRPQGLTARIFKKIPRSPSPRGIFAYQQSATRRIAAGVALRIGLRSWEHRLAFVTFPGKHACPAGTSALGAS